MNFVHVAKSFFITPATNFRSRLLNASPEVLIYSSLPGETLSFSDVAKAGVIASKGKAHTVQVRPLSLPFPVKLLVIVDSGGNVPTGLIDVSE